MDTVKKSVCILLAVLAITSALAIAYSFNGDSTDFSNSDIRIVRTNSMDGAKQSQYAIDSIPTNSLIMIHNLGNEDLSSLAVGDVIAFNYDVSPGKTVLDCHRIAEIYSDDAGITGFKTQGDRYIGTSVYEYPTAEDTVGKVVNVSSEAGSAVAVIQDNLMIWAMMAIVTLVVISAFIDLIRTKMEVDAVNERVRKGFMKNSRP